MCIGSEGEPLKSHGLWDQWMLYKDTPGLLLLSEGYPARTTLNPKP